MLPLFLSEPFLTRVLCCASNNEQEHGWHLQDFVKFYRPDDCRKAMALARERDGDSRTEEDIKRAELIAEGNKVNWFLCVFVRRCLLTVPLTVVLLLSLLLLILVLCVGQQSEIVPWCF